MNHPIFETSKFTIKDCSSTAIKKKFKEILINMCVLKLSLQKLPNPHSLHFPHCSQTWLYILNNKIAHTHRQGRRVPV